MAQELEPLNLRITGSTNGLSAALGKGQRDIAGFAQTIQDQASKISSRVSSIAAIVLPAGLAGGAGFGVKLAADAQDAELTFKALTGSMEKAKSVLADLQAFSASTPFEFTQDVKPAAQQLLTYGFSVEELKTQLTILGNVAAVSGADFTELAKLVGRARSTNLLFTEDLNQFSDRAIPVLDMLAQRFGVTGAEVRKMASEGKINFSDLQAVLVALGGEGGKFASAMEERSQTLNGQISTLKDNFTLLSQKIGEALIPAVNQGVQVLAEIVDWMRNLDADTVETTAKVAAFTAGFAAATLILPKVIAIGKELIITLRAIATAQGVAQALSGPAGWATLAAGIAAAGAAVYGVDKLFDGLAESQKSTAVASGEVAKGFKEVEKRTVDSGKELKELEKQQKKLVNEAERFRDELATPIEAYYAKIDKLGDAVVDGGLEFEFFARGVAKAYEELEKATSEADKFQLPKAILAGTQEDLLATLNPQGKKRNDLLVEQRQAVRDEVEALQKRLAEVEREKRDSVFGEGNPVAQKLDQANNKLDEVKRAIESSKPNTRPVNL